MVLFRLASDNPRGFEVHKIDRELTISPRGVVTQLEQGHSQQRSSGQAWLVPWRARKPSGVASCCWPGLARCESMVGLACP